jgi:hypothetical protein
MDYHTFKRPHIFDLRIGTPLTADMKKRLLDVDGKTVRTELIDALLSIAEEYNLLQGLKGRVNTYKSAWEVRYARKQTELRVAFQLTGAGPIVKKFSHSLEPKGRRHKIRVTESIIEDGWTWDAKTRTLTHSSGKTEIVP